MKRDRKKEFRIVDVDDNCECHERDPKRRRVTNGNRSYRSRFRQIVLETIQTTSPDDFRFKLEYKIYDPDSKDVLHVIGLVARLSDDKPYFAVEVDGDKHYTSKQRARLTRDRYVEAWCVKKGVPLIRIPCTLHVKKELEVVVQYIFNAAKQDNATGTTRVHYIDYEKTYANINKLALEDARIQSIDATPSPLNPNVYVWSPRK